ncbi:hypothetical protein L209DRAFT_755422 [Thermothelomyces heterothallicus CBS 203.75]
MSTPPKPVGEQAALTPADVVFAEATPHQRVLSWRLNGASWAPPMTIEQYVGRETALSQTALSANGGTRYYVLHPDGDPDTIVSACEVTAKRALVAGAGTSAGPREVRAYSVASVFTNPRFRERGMASHMLRRVQEVVDGDGDGDGDDGGYKAEFGALYSDIGRVYYTRLGWKDFRSPQVLLGLGTPAAAAAAAAAAVVVPEGVSLLTADEVAPLCERDVAAIRERFERLARSGGGGGAADNNGKKQTHIAFLPTPEQMAWHFTRDKYVCQKLLGREVVHRGARTEDQGGGGGSGWICWDHDLREKKLKVLRIVTREQDGPEARRGAVRKLLLAALAEAKGWGLPKVLVWSPGAEVAGAATDIWRELGPEVSVTFEEREDGSIPSLRWKGGKGPEEIVWESNEYYAWC